MVLPTISYQNKYNDEFLFLLLTNRFYALCDAIEAKYGVYINSSVEIPWLKRQYINNKRFYHDIRHIMFTLELYDIIKTEIKDVEKRMAMQWALIYHDIIYMPERGDDFNIPESIDVALYSLSDARLAKFSGLVKEYIMATHHFNLMQNESERMSLNKESKYISDIDLFGFTLQQSQVFDNTDNIRKEFSHLSVSEFNAGQSKFLQNILNLKSIYLTQFFGKFESIARTNIENLIKHYSLTNNQ